MKMKELMQILACIMYFSALSISLATCFLVNDLSLVLRINTTLIVVMLGAIHLQSIE